MSILATLSSWGSSASTSPTRTQIIADYSDTPTLYTLDTNQGEIDESVSHSELLINRLLPWTREQHHRFPWNKADRVYRSSSCKVSAFTLGPKKHLYAVDEEASRLCVFDRDGNSTVLWSGSPLVSPHSVATLSGDVLYVADKGANTVFAFSVTTHYFLQSYWDNGDVPDKIVGARGQIVGMNYAKRAVVQMLVSDGSADSSTSPAGSVFRIRRSVYDTIVEPVDFGIDGAGVYILDNGSGLIYLSLSGANLMTLRLVGITKAPHPSSIAVAHPDTLHLIFSTPDRGAEVIQNIRPATIYLDQNNPDQGLLESYKYLLARKLLPTDTKTYTDVDAFIRDLADQGLTWNGPNHRDVADLISKLNGDKGERDLVSLTATGIQVPSLQVVRYNAKRKITLPLNPNTVPTPTLGEYVKSWTTSIPAANTGHAASDDNIKSILDTLNYSYSGKDIVNEVSGTYIVPVPALRFAAFVSAWVGDPAYKGAKEIEQYGSIVPLGNTHVSIQTEAESDDAAGDTKGQWRDFVHLCKVKDVSASYLGVVDFQIDHTHPEFSSVGKISTYLASNAPPSQQSESSAAPAAGFDYSAAFQAGATHPATENDHGTHVAALAAGNLTGIDRYAIIKDVSVDNFVTAVRDADNPIQIYNLSLGEKYYTANEAETLRTWIDTVSDETNGGTLFVIAAGNDHTQITKGMLAFAGLRNNVIVVAASDTVAQPPTEWLDGDQHHGSNFGYPSVGLYAPGRDIESATFGGQYGVASGTSQATALVSGAASLLKGIDRDYKPWQIKERLISTSSLDGWIDRDHSKGGMLDISHAIHNLNRTVIRYSYETVDCVADIVSADGGQVDIKGDKAWKLGAVGFSDIRRIHRISPMRDDFELFISYLDPESGNRKLYRTEIIHSPDVSAPQLKMLNSSDCGNKTELDLSQIDDLYNPVLNE